VDLAEAGMPRMTEQRFPHHLPRLFGPVEESQSQREPADDFRFIGCQLRGPTQRGEAFFTGSVTNRRETELA
jgi:hypothetical protein